MKTPMSLVLLLSLGTASHSQQVPPVNIRIHPSNITQTEPVATVHPENPDIIFASAVTIDTSNGVKSEGVYFSTNAGTNWFGWDACSGQSTLNHGGDPVVMIHSPGRMILAHIGSIFPGWYSHYSENFGSTWSNAYTISSQLTEDKGSGTMDETSTSPYYGRGYLTWVALVQPYPVLASHSTNAATSWTTPTQINPSPPSRCSGGSVVTGRDGKVYVTWAGMLGVVQEDFVGFAVSSTGGTSWSVTQNAFDMNGIGGTLPAKSNIRVNGLPQIDVDRSGTATNGWLYIVTGERGLAPAGSDPDIILHRSTNGGQTWSSGIRVNQDALNNVRTQYFPALAVDQGGGVNVIYYDDRNTSTDSSEMFLARSTDAGVTWTERVISDHRFKPKPIVGGSSNYQGDHICLLPIGTKLYAFWMDDFAGIYQVWLAIIDLITDVADEEMLSLPQELTLSANYPNPFNPSTTIEYGLPKSGLVALRIVDVAGKEVAQLVDQWKPAGKHSVVFNTGNLNLASGVYFCQLSSEGSRLTKPMVLLK